MGNKNTTAEPEEQKNSTTTTTKTAANNPNDADAIANDASLWEWENDPKILKRFDFDAWYPIVSEFTMTSKLIACTPEEIQAIIDGCDAHRTNGDPSKYTPAHQQVLQTLAEKIEQFIVEHSFQTQGIFVRFSKRSPKDAILTMDKQLFASHVEAHAMQLFRKEKQSALSKNENNNNGNGFDANAMIINCIIRAMAYVSCDKLCMHSGAKAIQLIIHSQRIFQDFKIGELMMGNDFQPRLILREFNHNIDFECEFRVFVFRDEITAISQYTSIAYIPRIAENRNTIQQSIYEYWKYKIAPLMNNANVTSSYVMDIALLKEEDEESDGKQKQKKTKTKKKKKKKKQFVPESVVAVAEAVADTDSVVPSNPDVDVDVDVDVDTNAENMLDMSAMAEAVHVNCGEIKDFGLFDIVLIEMNPFCTKAGALLFDWQTDVKLLTSPPTTFRICEAPYDKKPPKLTSELDPLFNHIRQEMQTL